MATSAEVAAATEVVVATTVAMVAAVAVAMTASIIEVVVQVATNGPITATTAGREVRAVVARTEAVAVNTLNHS